MALNAKKVSGGGNKEFVEQEILEAGVYPGRMVQVIDLGLQAQRAFQGKDKPPAQEIMLTYELVDTFMKDEDGEELEDKPRWVSEVIPLHNLKADRAKSTLRYKALDPTEEFGGDFSQLVDIPCNITLVQNVKGDKTYVNVAGIAAMRPKDAQKCEPLKNEAKVFDLDEPDMDIYNSLPEWIQDKIKANLNFKGSALEKNLGAAPKNPDPKQVKRDEKMAKAANPVENDEEDKPW